MFIFDVLTLVIYHERKLCKYTLRNDMKTFVTKRSFSVSWYFFFINNLFEKRQVLVRVQNLVCFFLLSLYLAIKHSVFLLIFSYMYIHISIIYYHYFFLQYLVSTLYAATYLKQIINPLLLVYVEFFSN